MTAVSPDASRQAVVEAALVLLERMGLSPADLAAVPQPRSDVPTFAEYVPVVSAVVSTGTRRAYGSYWKSLPSTPGCSPTGHGCPIPGGQDDRSRVTGDCQARICGGPGLRCPGLPDLPARARRPESRRRSPRLDQRSRPAPQAHRPPRRPHRQGTGRMNHPCNLSRAEQACAELAAPSKAAALGAVSWVKAPGAVDVMLLRDGRV